MNLQHRSELWWQIGVLVLTGLAISAETVRAADAGGTSVFGSEEASDSALMGIFYDLKQTQQHEVLGVKEHSYAKVVSEFVNRGYDESFLDQFYRATKPLYATQVFVPLMMAGEAPKAFGVEKTVEPSRWVIHYKGQVSPPENGTYRFAGYADDMIVVAVGGHTVLNGSREDTLRDMTIPWKAPGPLGAIADNGNLTMGDWIDLKTTDRIDLDVLIGERPGGGFCAFLMVQKKGVNYEMRNGFPVIPIFQVAKNDSVKDFPVADAAPWKCYQ